MKEMSHQLQRQVGKGVAIRSGLQDLRNLFSDCIHIYGGSNVDKALGGYREGLRCLPCGGISSYRTNNQRVEDVKCHKRWPGEVLGEEPWERKGDLLSAVAMSPTLSSHDFC